MIRKPNRHASEGELEPAQGAELPQRDDGQSAPPTAHAHGARQDRDPGSRPETIEVSEAAADLVKQLTAERDEALEGRLRALADFRNYQRRAGENEQRALQSGSARVVKAMMPVLDHFDMTV